MSSDTKFAFRKDQPIVKTLRQKIAGGDSITYEQLVDATDSQGTGRRTGMTTFLTGSAGREKGEYVIFQYGLVVRDSAGRVARFQRDADDKGYGVRNLQGSSILVSGSRMMVPTEAIESIVADNLSLGTARMLNHIDCLGFAYNRQPRRDGVERADYLFAIYSLTLNDIRLNGLVQEDADQFFWWSDPHDLTSNDVNGEIDRVVLSQVLKTSTPQAHVPEGDFGVTFNPHCRLVDEHAMEMLPAPFEAKASKTIFISHDAGAQLKAFFLRDVLIKRSRGRLYPFLDVHLMDRSQDQFWNFIESHIEQSDIFLLLVTSGTAQSKGVLRELDYRATLPNPPRLIVLQVDGNQDDIPAAVLGVSVINYVGRQYRSWPAEIEHKITDLAATPFRADTLNAKSPLPKQVHGSDSA